MLELGHFVLPLCLQYSSPLITVQNFVTLSFVKMELLTIANVKSPLPYSALSFPLPLSHDSSDPYLHGFVFLYLASKQL